MKEIPLTRGYVALVDDSDYSWLSQWKWTAIKHKDGSIHAVRRTRASEGKRRIRVAMHRAIMGASSSQQVDHINHDTLDNRRCNLRLCTQSQNNMNQRRTRRNTSGYKGVHWDAKYSKWVAKIHVGGRHIWLGRHERIEDAAKAYANASAKYHGEFGALG